MTRTQFSIFIAVIVAGFVTYSLAQSYGGIGFAPIAPAVANCPAGVTNGAMLCAVGTSAFTYAMYVSYNGGAYQPLVPAAAPAGVTTFNGRSGAVTLSKADVTATGIAITTSVTSTATSTVQ